MVKGLPQVVDWPWQRPLPSRWAWVGVGQWLGGWISVGGGHFCGGWDIPGAQWPQPCTVSWTLHFLLGLGKEGPFQVTLLSLSRPLPHTHTPLTRLSFVTHSPGSAGSQARPSRSRGLWLRMVRRQAFEMEWLKEAFEMELGPSWAIQIPGFKSTPPCIGSGT